MDHEAEARKIIAEYDAPDAEVWELADEIEVVVRRDAIALAQVHATLAVAEQQRLANLIAFMDGYDRQVRDAFIEYHGDTFGRITRGIGLFEKEAR